MARIATPTIVPQTLTRPGLIVVEGGRIDEHPVAGQRVSFAAIIRFVAAVIERDRAVRAITGLIDREAVDAGDADVFRIV